MGKTKQRTEGMRIRIIRELMLCLLLVCAVLFCGTVCWAGEAGQEEEYPAGWEVRYVTKNLCYTGSEEIVTIPAGITTLEQFAFYGNESVKAIYVPASVKSIENFSLYHIPNLRFIVFYGNPVMEKWALYDCPKLKNIAVMRTGTYAQTCAQAQGIPVYTGAAAGFPKRKVYLLKGDSSSQILCNSLTDVISWTSSKQSVASVTAKGKVKAKAAGKTVITALTASGTYQYTVQVYKKTVASRVKQIRLEENLSGKTAYEKVRDVHNWMIRNIRYDYKNYLKGKIDESLYARAYHQILSESWANTCRPRDITKEGMILAGLEREEQTSDTKTEE